MIRIWPSLVFLLSLSAVALAGTPVGSEITYQGRLQDADQPAHGLYDFRFTLLDAPVGGSLLAPPILLQEVPVEDGIFSVHLDFGVDAFAGDARFLGIAVRDADSIGDFDELTPPRPLTAAPYALYALSGNPGPQGEPGPMGAPGEQGPIGPPGLVWLGAWSSSTMYAIDDAVEYQGSSYIAVAPTDSDVPGVGASWQLLAAGATTGATFDASAIVSGELDPARLPSGGHWTLSSPLLLSRSTGSVGFGSSEGGTDLLIDASHDTATRFRVDSHGGALFGGAYVEGPSEQPLASGAGTRMLWYPQRAAIRAGSINGTQWDVSNIGSFSAAFGENVRASGEWSIAAGRNAVAGGTSTVAFGENAIATGAGSVALGFGANTNARQGAFVFADRSTVDELRAGVNHSANWRTSGGFRIFTSSNLGSGVTIQSGATTSNWGHANAVISTSSGATLSTSGIWSNASDVNRKHGFVSVDGEDILTRLRLLPISTWSYLVDSTDVRHIGPMAQDFHAVFGFGQDEKTIGTVDADGVALAAAKALEQRTSDQLALIELLQSENVELRRRLERLESLLSGN